MCTPNVSSITLAGSVGTGFLNVTNPNSDVPSGFSGLATAKSLTFLVYTSPESAYTMTLYNMTAEYSADNSFYDGGFGVGGSLNVSSVGNQLINPLTNSSIVFISPLGGATITLINIGAESVVISAASNVTPGTYTTYPTAIFDPDVVNQQITLGSPLILPTRYWVNVTINNGNTAYTTSSAAGVPYTAYDSTITEQIVSDIGIEHLIRLIIAQTKIIVANAEPQTFDNLCFLLKSQLIALSVNPTTNPTYDPAIYGISADQALAGTMVPTYTYTNVNGIVVPYLAINIVITIYNNQIQLVVNTT